MTAVLRFLSLFPLPSAPALRRTARRFAITAAVALALPAHAADTGSAWTLDRLMSTLAQHKSGRATFIETKTLSIAAQPLESSGELVFVAPDHLEKHTLSPKPEHLVVDGDMLTVERNNRKYTLALARYPELGAFIDSIRATLAGDRAALERTFTLQFAAEGSRWTLSLTPRDPKLAMLVRQIRIEGSADAISTVETLRADGDRSVMVITPVPDG